MNHNDIDRPSIPTPSWKRTRAAYRDEMTDVRRALVPTKRRKPEILSWGLALAAGFAALRYSLKNVAHAEPEEAASAPVPALPTADAPTVAEEDRSPAARENAHGIRQLGLEFARRFSEDECSTRAAALAFYGLLSLVPIILLALAALGFLVRSPQDAADHVQALLKQFLPGTRAADAAGGIIAQTHVVDSARTLMNGRWWAVVIGIISLLATAISLLVTAAEPMNRAWDVKETRGPVRLRLEAFGVFIGAAFLFALSLFPTAGPAAMHSLHILWLGLPEQPSFRLGAIFVLLSIAIDLAMFVLIYRFLPNAPVTWRAALFGGIVAGLLWEAFKRLFPLYLSHFGSYDKLYGTLGGLMLLVSWIYYSSNVLLAGAILCKMYHEHREERGVVRRPPGRHEAT